MVREETGSPGLRVLIDLRQGRLHLLEDRAGVNSDRHDQEHDRRQASDLVCAHGRNDRVAERRWADGPSGGGVRHRLVSVGRYALRGVSRPQELFTLDPDP